MDEAKLKPCPFCGGKPVIYKSVLNRMVWVVCSECGATSPSGFREKTAIKAWNRRINNDNDQILLLRSSGVHVRADGAHAVHDSGAEGNQQENGKEEQV